MTTKTKLPTCPVIDFVAADGHEISFPAKMTIADLIKAGVTSIRIVDPKHPLEPNEYRDKGDPIRRRKPSTRRKAGKK